MAITVHNLPVLADNRVPLLVHEDAETAVVFDPGDADPVLERLEELGCGLSAVLITHHHDDHVGGVRRLKRETGATVFAPTRYASRIPVLDVGVSDGDELTPMGMDVRAIHTPGHTLDHMCYWVASEGILICADTLMYLSVGRLFEGSPAMLWRSLLRLRGLPGATKVYSGHDYARVNVAFTLDVNPADAEVAALAQRLDQGWDPFPATLSFEIAHNLFLRADDPDIAALVGLGPEASPEAVVAELRARRDSFRYVPDKADDKPNDAPQMPDT